MQSITAGSLRKCPKCKTFNLKKLIGAGSGIIFKGNGFYETDYKHSKDYKKQGESSTVKKKNLNLKKEIK